MYRYFISWLIMQTIIFIILFLLVSREYLNGLEARKKLEWSSDESLLYLLKLCLAIINAYMKRQFGSVCSLKSLLKLGQREGLHKEYWFWIAKTLTVYYSFRRAGRSVVQRLSRWIAHSLSTVRMNWSPAKNGLLASIIEFRHNR